MKTDTIQKAHLAVSPRGVRKQKQIIEQQANKAQHSAATTPHSVPLTPYVREACDNYGTLKRHADKLADALRQCLQCHSSNAPIHSVITQALQSYEAAQ